MSQRIMIITDSGRYTETHTTTRIPRFHSLLPGPSVVAAWVYKYGVASESAAKRMASTPGPGFNYDLNSTIGALQIGIVLSCVLFGVTTTQAYTYYGRFPDDSHGLKFLVAVVWLCELAHIICIEATHYRYTISDFLHPANLFFVYWPIAVSLLFSGIIVAGVQGFFALRIYRLSRRAYIPGFIWILAFSRTIFCVVAVVYGSQPNVTINGFVGQRSWVFYALWGVSTTNDLIIASALVYCLYSQRVKANTRTVALVDKLIKWTIETGVITSASTTLTVIFFAIQKDNDIWVIFYTLTARLYANSLLASLNSRTTLRAMDDNTVPYSAHELAFRTATEEVSKVTE
ncbi:hypothetical protein B0H17DRAFT_1046489, partial [Mycena rosella]